MSQGAVMPVRSQARVVAGDARINFAAHQVRANAHGAREDFEEMIGQLVKAVRPGVARDSGPPAPHRREPPASRRITPARLTHTRLGELVSLAGAIGSAPAPDRSWRLTRITARAMIAASTMIPAEIR